MGLGHERHGDESKDDGKRATAVLRRCDRDMTVLRQSLRIPRQRCVALACTCHLRVVICGLFHARC
ncbi:hypothetical protein XHV734_5090 [Xanthomonas hortorum pv. vitians]|nr:hypothetical protein XHV734_5090 [Xanthomonas hortorum pv. vitians]